MTASPFRPSSFAPCLRLVILATTAFGTLGAIPAFGSDSASRSDAPRITLTGADRWRLRPADVAGTTSPPAARERPASEIPPERRAVRVVYPGLLGER